MLVLRRDASAELVFQGLKNPAHCSLDQDLVAQAIKQETSPYQH